MTIDEFINSQPEERQQQMQKLHQVIIANDPSVVPEVGTMMRNEMILYQENCQMKYALSSVKNHLSLHCLPIYMVPALHAKYSTLLPQANVQKGCINFKNTTELPASIAEELIAECAAINLADMLANRKKK
jgi:uncharacterized protein DUF1801